VETAASRPPAAPTAGGRRPRDLALSLLVLLLPIVVLLGIYRIVLGGDAPVLVDPAPTVEQARADGAFPVAVPGGLGSGWRTVSASYQRGDGAAVLRIGYLTPKGAGVQLVESDVPAEILIPRELTSQARPQGTVEVAGRQWQRYTARQGEGALILLEPDRAVIVVGAAEDAELRELAAALPR
jgi:hypothetical protein